jgi:hypothetical protein
LGQILVGAIRRVAPGPAALCGNRAKRLGKGLTRLMLSACNALPPGPQLKHSGNVNPPQAGLPAEPGVYLKEIKGLKLWLSHPKVP